MAGKRITSFRPKRGAVKIVARDAFNYQKSYGADWEEYRRKHPLIGLCIECRQRPAKSRHHDMPISKGGAKLTPAFISELCEKCHQKKHRHMYKARSRRRK